MDVAAVVNQNGEDSKYNTLCYICLTSEHVSSTIIGIFIFKLKDASWIQPNLALTARTDGFHLTQSRQAASPNKQSGRKAGHYDLSFRQ